MKEALRESARDVPLVGHFIGGREVAGSEVLCGDVWNPALGRRRARVAFAGAEEVDAAVTAAREAYPSWAAIPPARRAGVLFRFRELLVERRDALAALVTAEHGKTLDDARGELTRGIEVVEFACGIPELLKGEMTENVGRGVDAFTIRQPLGVCAGITPFNFPVMVPLWMFPIAVACGNTFVLKPSEKDPSAAIELARLFQASGAPPGVLNVVNGAAQTVDALLDHPEIAAVSFVGSTPVAEHVFTRAHARGKRVQALGGAKNHLVILPDADLEHAAGAILGAAYGSAGERCMAVSVVVAVGDDVADALAASLERRLERLVIGDGADPATEMGPLVTADHLARVRSYIDLAEREGAQVRVDGRTHPCVRRSDGFFLGPTLLDRVRSSMRVYREEIFGPVLCLVRAASREEALELVNAHEYGNGASIFTRSGEVARWFSHSVVAGMVGVNIPIPVPMAFHSFGGWKRSLFGDHHMHGPEGVRFYTRLKAVTVSWPASSAAGGGFSMPTS